MMMDLINQPLTNDFGFVKQFKKMMYYPVNTVN